MSHWQKREISWWETKVVNCSLCGQMIPRDIWVSDEGLGFCSADCEQLYRRYWVPTYGPRRGDFTTVAGERGAPSRFPRSERGR